MYLILIHFFYIKTDNQLTRRVEGAEKLDKIDAYYSNLLILFNIKIGLCRGQDVWEWAEKLDGHERAILLDALASLGSMLQSESVGEWCF